MITGSAKLLRCDNPNCRMPLTKQQGGKLFVLRDQDSSKATVNIEVPYDNGGSYRVQCGKCGRSKIFVMLTEKLRIHDEDIRDKVDVK